MTITDERPEQAPTGLFEPQAQPHPQVQPGHLLPPKPVTVALLGDERYAEALAHATHDRTLNHELVLPPVPSARSLAVDLTTEVDRDLLDLDMARVTLANYVMVVAPDGYVSPHQAALISYASRMHRTIVWWHWGDAPSPQD
jgi:hypothetical protein